MKLEVIKSIEARKLNKRTRQPVSEPPVTIPYGAILSEIVENDLLVNFHYLGDYYQCRTEVLRSASHPLDGGTPSGGASGSPAETAAAPASAPIPVTFVFEKLQAGSHSVSRAKLPGGWLISVGDGPGRSVTFYPDPGHTWDGTTL